MRLLRPKFGKICQWTETSTIFSKIAHVNCMFTQENLCTVEAHKHFIIVYKSVLSVFTQEFSLVVWLRVRPENEPQKNWSVLIFLVVPTKKNSL